MDSGNIINFSSSTYISLSYFSGQRSSFMPFSLKEIEHMSSVLCTVVIGIIEIIYPDASPAFTGQYLAAMKSVGAKSALMKKDEFYPKEKWIKLLKVGTLWWCRVIPFWRALQRFSSTLLSFLMDVSHDYALLVKLD